MQETFRVVILLAILKADNGIANSFSAPLMLREAIEAIADVERLPKFTAQDVSCNQRLCR